MSKFVLQVIPYIRLQDLNTDSYAQMRQLKRSYKFGTHSLDGKLDQVITEKAFSIVNIHMNADAKRAAPKATTDLSTQVINLERELDSYRSKFSTIREYIKKKESDFNQ